MNASPEAREDARQLYAMARQYGWSDRRLKEACAAIVEAEKIAEDMFEQKKKGML